MTPTAFDHAARHTPHYIVLTLKADETAIVAKVCVEQDDESVRHASYLIQSRSPEPPQLVRDARHREERMRVMHDTSAQHWCGNTQATPALSLEQGAEAKQNIPSPARRGGGSGPGGPAPGGDERRWLKRRHPFIR